jgi:calcineurin-like phosphoesterase family protein
MSGDVFFVSDTHFDHARVIEYSKRPFADVDEMNEAIIDNWNRVVRPGDRVYHLGDFSFARRPEDSIAFAKRLTGQKYLVFGNHDKRLRDHQEFLRQWVWTKDLAQIEIDGQKIILCHYAMITWNQSHRGSFQLHGHSHGSLPEDKHALRVDVGVDCWNYEPVSFEQVKAKMATKDYQPIDHHGE